VHHSTSDIKRLFAVRQALTLFDYADDTTNSVKDLLTYCFGSQLFYKSLDGKKFLAFAFTLDGDLLVRFHAMVKMHLPDASKTLIESLGDIYFKAWKQAEEPVLSRLGLFL
jgi:condensin-2 complex subunit G2